MDKGAIQKEYLIEHISQVKKNADKIYSGEFVTRGISWDCFLSTIDPLVSSQLYHLSTRCIMT